MVEELLKQKELIEEEKMMNAIHKNYKDTRMNRKIDEQLKFYEKKEEERHYSKLNKILLITLVIFLIIELIVVGV